MSLPDDLKDYHAKDDPFVILTPDQCVILLLATLAFALILAPYL